MSSTPDKPPPRRSSFPSPRQSDPYFAQFLQSACLPPSRLLPALKDLQQALGDSPSVSAASAMHNVLESCRTQQTHIDELSLLMQECCKTLRGLDPLTKPPLLRCASLPYYLYCLRRRALARVLYEVLLAALIAVA